MKIGPIRISGGALLLTLSGAAALPAAEAAKPSAPVAPAAQAKEPGEGPLQNMKFRNLGPAVGGGRVTAVAGVPGDPNVIYVGAAAGGVWKSVDGGNSFKAIFEKFQAVPQQRNLPSAPKFPVQYLPEADRPQPRKDVERERGMVTFVGRLRECPVFDWKFVALGHNTVRGAAGAAVLNAELLNSEGLI